MEQEDVKVTASIFATNDHLINLKTINNIRFTGREIDIIACIIGGRSYKKTSSFLDISSNTVECHIRNIMLKIGCNSRENIIDFLEKSDKFALIKKHYSNLLIKATFASELKKILSLTRDNNIGCLLFYYKKHKGKDLFVDDLEKHLNNVGINTVSKIWERGKAENFLFDKLESQPVNYIIYIITDDFLAQLNKSKHAITEETASLIMMLKQPASNVIFLLANNELSLEAKVTSANFTYVNLQEHSNYYLLVFELIKKLLPSSNIDQNINDFKKNQVAFQQHSQAKIWLKEEGNSATSPTSYFGRSKKVVISWAIIFLLIINISFIIFNNKKHIVISNKVTNEERQTNMFFPQAEINYDGKTIRSTLQRVFNLPPRNLKFTGRNISLQNIKHQLSKGEFGVVMAAVSGLGGVGKTQLATEFAYRAAKNKIYDAIFWLAAETDIVLTNSYKEFAKQLQINVKGLKSKDIQVLVQRELSNKFNNKKVLFILDNVPSYNNIQEYLSKLHKQWSVNGLLHVLITTRSQYWPENPWILDVFDEDEATEFIKKHLPNEENIAIEKLAKTLNYFPLALKQAVAYIKEHTNIDDYLKLYAQQKYKFLDQTATENDQYRESLWKTWNISLAKLTNNAQSMLFIAAYLEPDDIPIDFFTNLTIEERGNAIKELRKHSFISLKNRNKAFKIHRLLQDVIRLSISVTNKSKHIKLFGKKTIAGEHAEHIWLNKAISLLDGKFDFDYMQCEKWHEWNRNLSHARSIAEHTIKLQGETFTRGLRLYCKVAMFMTHVNLSSDVLEMWLKIKDLLIQQYKETHELIMAKIYYNLGVVMIHSKAPEQAKDYFQQAILMVQNKNSPMTTETWDFLSELGNKSFHNKDAIVNYKNKFLEGTFIVLGNVERQLGNFSQAIINYNKTLAILKDEPPDNRTTYYKINVGNQLGYSYLRAGQLIPAEQVLQEAKREVDLQYKDHIIQAYVYVHLAKLQYSIGELNKAKELLTTALQIEETVHAKQHLEMAEINFDLARIELADNNIRQAKTKLEEAEKIYKLYYVDDNIYEYINLYLFFGKIHEYLGEHNKALDYIARALTIAKGYYKENLHAAMALQITTAETWPQLSAKDKVDYWQKALPIMVKLFGAKHYQVARYHYLLGQALENKGDVAVAQLQYETALKILRNQTINHPNLTRFHQEHTQLIQKRLTKLSQHNNIINH